MAVIRKIHRWFLAGFALAAAVGLVGRAHAQELTIGTIGASSDAPLFIADAKGYFAEQGLKVKFMRFDSAAKMIPSLGSGEVDVGSGATSAGLYNAVKRGIDIKIVSDKARNAPGYGFEAIMVRTDLMESGKVKSLKDFKGLKVAMSANGNSENAIMNYALVQNGLRIQRHRPGVSRLSQSDRGLCQQRDRREPDGRADGDRSAEARHREEARRHR